MGREKIGFDTAENEPSKVLFINIYKLLLVTCCPELCMGRIGTDEHIASRNDPRVRKHRGE